MSEYFFILGNTPELAKAEISAVLSRKKISFKPLFFNNEVLAVKTEENLDANSLMKTLGGTVKIAKICAEISEKEEVSEKISTILLQSEIVGQKIVFGLSGYGGVCLNDLNHLNREIKDKLEKAGYKARFILAKEGMTLSSVVIAKQKIEEIILVKNGEKLLLAKTLVVQDFESWAKRDFGRPEADPKTGMLAPKVARMMVNLASQGVTLQRPIVLDPFCGSGTILAEAMMMGMNVIGNDLVLKQIERTKKNLEWLKTNFQFSIFNSQKSSAYSQLFQGDATHISEKIAPGSVDAIVTEPYLGPADGFWTSQNDERHKIENIVLGLNKLYIGCLRDWRKILKPGGTVVIAFPSFKIKEKEFFVKKALDSCENFGYTLVGGPYQYSRPQAIVRRNIYVLERHSGK